MASRPVTTASRSSSLFILDQPIDRPRPNQKNARRHDKRQINLLAESIRAFGFNLPILVDGDNVIIAGHGRLLAAKEVGLRKVPTIRIDHLGPEQIQAFQIADNRLAELSVWDESLLTEQLQALAEVDLDFNIEATGFSVGEIDLRIEGVNANCDTPDPADDIPDVAPITVTRPGDLWILGPHRLLCGDALDPASFEVLMGGDLATMVFTDPPYNIPIDGFVGGKGKVKHREFGMGTGEMSSAQFENFLTTVFRNLAHSSIDGSLHYACMDWRHLKEILAAGSATYQELKNICVWAKDRAGMGSFYRSQHEFIMVFKSGKAKSRNNIELGRNGRHRSNVWSYPSVLNSRHGEEGDLLALHPTVKPIRLVADAILDASARGDLILDPFLGSGSTLMACQRVGRVCRGIELDPAYVDVAIRRWQRDTGEPAIHAASGETFAQRERKVLKVSPPAPKVGTKKSSKYGVGRSGENHG